MGKNWIGPAAEVLEQFSIDSGSSADCFYLPVGGKTLFYRAERKKEIKSFEEKNSIDETADLEQIGEHMQRFTPGRFPLQSQWFWEPIWGFSRMGRQYILEQWFEDRYSTCLFNPGYRTLLELGQGARTLSHLGLVVWTPSVREASSQRFINDIVFSLKYLEELHGHIAVLMNVVLEEAVGEKLSRLFPNLRCIALNTIYIGNKFHRVTHLENFQLFSWGKLACALIEESYPLGGNRQSFLCYRLPSSESGEEQIQCIQFIVKPFRGILGSGLSARDLVTIGCPSRREERLSHFILGPLKKGLKVWVREFLPQWSKEGFRYKCVSQRFVLQHIESFIWEELPKEKLFIHLWRELGILARRLSPGGPSVPQNFLQMIARESEFWVRRELGQRPRKRRFFKIPNSRRRFQPLQNPADALDFWSQFARSCLGDRPAHFASRRKNAQIYFLLWKFWVQLEPRAARLCLKKKTFRHLQKELSRDLEEAGSRTLILPNPRGKIFFRRRINRFFQIPILSFFSLGPASMTQVLEQELEKEQSERLERLEGLKYRFYNRILDRLTALRRYRELERIGRQAVRVFRKSFSACLSLLDWLGDRLGVKKWKPAFLRPAGISRIWGKAVFWGKSVSGSFRAVLKKSLCGLSALRKNILRRGSRTAVWVRGSYRGVRNYLLRCMERIRRRLGRKV